MNLLFAIFMSLTAQAQSADVINTVITCKPMVMHPDVGMKVTVREGGLAGLTSVRVEHSFMGHITMTEYYVKVKPVPSHRLGAGVTYFTDGIVLHTNFTTAPLADGGHYGVFTNSIPGQEESDELSCKLN